MSSPPLYPLLAAKKKIRPIKDDFLEEISQFLDYRPKSPYLTSGYPLVICYIAIENGHLYIVEFPIKNGDFPYYPLVN